MFKRDCWIGCRNYLSGLLKKSKKFLPKSKRRLTGVLKKPRSCLNIYGPSLIDSIPTSRLYTPQLILSVKSKLNWMYLAACTCFYVSIWLRVKGGAPNCWISTCESSKGHTFLCTPGFLLDDALQLWYSVPHEESKRMLSLGMCDVTSIAVIH